MSQPSKPKYVTVADWDTAYREGTPPWDVGRPHAELARVLDEYRLRPQTVLEVGCGTGADAIVLGPPPLRGHGRRLFAHRHRAGAASGRAERRRAPLRARRRLRLRPHAGQFDFVYDAGLYHAVRQTNLERYLDMLWRVTRPGSYYLCLAGAPSETAEDGPPQVTEDEMHNELGRLFEFVHLRPTQLESANPSQSYAGWSCLMLRPLVGGK